MVSFTRKLIPPWLLFEEIQRRGAATTKELKLHFGVDSSSIRQSLAPLLAADAVWVVSKGRGFVFYMVNTGKRGAPNPTKARWDAKRGQIYQPGHPLDFKQEMMKQVIVFDQVGWRGEKRAQGVVAEVSDGERVTRVSFDDDEEAVEL